MLTSVPAGSRVLTEEIFGPVVSIEPFDSVDAVVTEVNSLEYGLQAGVFTRDLDAALDVAQRLRVGAVMINDTGDFRIDAMPFGGSKRSGVGREGVPFAVDAMTEPKIIAIHRSSPAGLTPSCGAAHLRGSARRLLRGTDRELLGLAIPALGALLAEPVFLLADSAIVGHLGTAQLAGLGIASAVLLNAVFLCIFLAHGTTAAVARQAGAGDLRRAYTLGVDGIWLAVAIGVGLGGLGLVLAPVLVDLLGASGPGDAVCADLPADQPARPARHARRPGRDRRPAGTEGHPYAAARDRPGSRRERPAQPRARLPARAGGGGLSARHRDRPGGSRRLAGRGRGPRRPPSRRAPAPRPAGHRGDRPARTCRCSPAPCSCASRC